MKLKEGMIFRNYNELCSFMNWKNTRGNTKVARLKELDSICKWERQGNKIVINSIYNEQRAIEDNRSKNNIYIDTIETLLIFLLNSREKEDIFISKTKLYKILGMFNNDFEDLCYGNLGEIANDLVVDYLTVKSFKMSSKSEANKIINRALKSMKKRRAIEFEEGRILVEKNGVKRFATVQELNIIKSIENEAMKKLGCSSYSQIEFKNLTNKYYDEIEKDLLKSEVGEMNFMFEGYCIRSCHSRVKRWISRNEKDENLKKINELFGKKLVATAIVRHNSAKRKAELKSEFGEPMLMLEASEKYLNDYKKLVEEYVTL